MFLKAELHKESKYGFKRINCQHYPVLFFEKIITRGGRELIVLNPFLDSLCNSAFKNIDLTPGIPKSCFQNPQDIVIHKKLSMLKKFEYARTKFWGNRWTRQKCSKLKLKFGLLKIAKKTYKSNLARVSDRAFGTFNYIYIKKS